MSASRKPEPSVELKVVVPYGVVIALMNVPLVSCEKEDVMPLVSVVLVNSPLEY